jgi:hypothetical protein
MKLVPLELADARRFIAEHHRHNGAPTGWRFGVGLEDDGVLIGVAVAARPNGHWGPGARPTVEILRCCTDGTRNACTMLYGAVCRAAKALGYQDAITYTLQSEPGASLRAAGFHVEAELPARGYGGGRPRYESNLLGEAVRPEEPKLRWRRHLVPLREHAARLSVARPEEDA